MFLDHKHMFLGFRSRNICLFLVVDTIALVCLEYYCVGIVDCSGAEFLYRHTVTDTQHLLAKAGDCGFSGMLGSIDCIHWQWLNCLVGWRGKFG
jgi:hypothetical protein